MQATPFVAGALAAMKAKYPAFTLLQHREALLTSGYDSVSRSDVFVTVPPPDQTSKFKRLNLDLALSAASSPPSIPDKLAISTVALALTTATTIDLTSATGLLNIATGLDLSNAQIPKRLVDSCNSVAMSRLTIPTWNKNLYRFTLPISGSNYTIDTGCGSTTINTILAVIKCGISGSDLDLTRCECLVDDNGCGTSGGPSKTGNLLYESTGYAYYAAVVGPSATSTGSFKLNAVVPSVVLNPTCSATGVSPCNNCCFGCNTARNRCK